MKKIAIIVGGHQRIGLTISQHVSLAGWDVLLGARTGVGAANELDGILNETPNGVWQVDFLDSHKTTVDFESILNRFSDRDEVALIINASTFENDNVNTLTAEMLSRYMTLHFETPVLLIGKMAKLGARGQVVLLLDQNVVNIHNSHLSYCLSKEAMYHALPRLSHSIFPTRINAVAPGAVMPDEGADADAFNNAVKNSPLETPITPDDVAQAVVYLLNTNASGQTVFVDSGQHLKQWIEPANFRKP